MDETPNVGAMLHDLKHLAKYGNTQEIRDLFMESLARMIEWRGRGRQN